MKLPALTIIGLISVSIQQDNISEGNHQMCVKSCTESQQERLGDHCYFWSTARKSWQDSEAHCQSKDGHLAAVTSLEIHNFLMKKVDTDTQITDTQIHTWFWIGGSDKKQEGKWEWADGSVWNFTHWADQPYKQPSNSTNQDCLQIYQQYNSYNITTGALQILGQNGWNDDFCNNFNPFICSWRICPGMLFLFAIC